MECPKSDLETPESRSEYQEGEREIEEQSKIRRPRIVESDTKC
jgi:hypothetical protein